MAYLLQQLASAVPIAALYALLAFGYSIAFALTRRADLAYGALFCFSGQVFLVFVDFGWSTLWLILPAALMLGVLCGMIYALGAGLLVAGSVLRGLVTTSANTVVIASLGVTLVLTEIARIAAQARSLWLPPFLNSPVVIWAEPDFPVTLTVIQILTTVLMLATLAVCQLFVLRSTWGRHWRAVSEDKLAAALCGVDGDRLFVMAYGFSAALAAFAGILATSYYGTMDFGAGIVFGVKVLFIAAIGGQSTPLKAAAGAAVMGLAETLWGAYGPILWRDFAIFSCLVLVLVLTKRQRETP